MIQCPGCGGPTQVEETRATGLASRRRRSCAACGKRVTTIEVIVKDRQDTEKILRVVQRRARPTTTRQKGQT